MPRKAAAVPSRVYQLKITLKGTKPPIWRRVEVADTITLATLHTI
ncbi:MAG: plasmid pRiA4b ORF-3 family protein, partial [Chloroflexia bacterium]|nr:plasmid pRiA4b ORF-3 family protein [Chloroflexia bacterium]